MALTTIKQTGVKETQRLIFNNRSKVPLYMIINEMFDLYFDYYDESIKDNLIGHETIIDGKEALLMVTLKTNKKSVTIKIEDNEQRTQSKTC